MRIIKLTQSQNYQGYFSGDIPEYAMGFVGTSSVDASQIKSTFTRVDEALSLVNQFNPSLLINVAFIFNFSKGGAYGVFLPALDRAIKTQALKKQLESKGYKIEVNSQGLLTAQHTKEGKTQDEIQQDIDVLYDNIQSKGGTAFGVNMQDVLQSAHQDAQSTKSEDPSIWEWMALLHLGATIVHEAIHSKGHIDEGASEAGEGAFLNWALPKVNDRYRQSLIAQGKEELFAPLTIGGTKRHAKNTSKTSWYKKAQMNYYPQEVFNMPTGSDLSGRFPVGAHTDQGVAGWSMLAQQDQSVPIEKRLSREFMSKLPKGLDQAHDHYDLQLEKFTKGLPRHSPHATTNDLLSEGYDMDRAYYTLEELLEEKRPKPLIVPIKKASASKPIKIATLFGWYNNLDISDGSTIPGLGDRVMSWESADEDFRKEEDFIKSQPRYNPEYDLKGFYYRWIDPRLKPTLWNDQDQDISGIHPARRFASKEDAGISRILAVLSLIKTGIKKGDFKSSRLIISDDLLPIINEVLGSTQECQYKCFELGSKANNDNLFSVWIYDSSIIEDQIDKAERFFMDESANDASIVEELTGYSKSKEKIINDILNEVKVLCGEYQIKDVYVIGNLPRDLILNKKISKINSLDFCSPYPTQCLKLGGLLAHRLNIAQSMYCPSNNTFSLEYKGIRLEFRDNYDPTAIKDQLRELGIETNALNIEVYNRDFTINMLLYNVTNGKVYDPCKSSINDIKDKTIRTFLNPDFICKENPIVILRALKLKLRYNFQIDGALQVAMIENAPLLFDGRYSEEYLNIGKQEVIAENKIEAEKLFEEFGIKIGE